MIIEFIKTEFYTNISGTAVKIALLLCAFILATTGFYVAFAISLLSLFVFGYVTHKEYKWFKRRLDKSTGIAAA
ncbi:hypothetical protein [Agrobacterium tumefaciens]|uniref:hypothetical protein n=1 Tax=Agrobacterium tumefaciens TaxID=358 RepID=UPI001572029E|nr:hypothetical protein [Agrobacterium tumefaciens]WCJ63835.1 hypothetical protein G6M15_06470 [Agrobacterium tumefaciens]